MTIADVCICSAVKDDFVLWWSFEDNKTAIKLWVSGK